jgi:enoyl-[acyl-carrier protein] reductase II
MKMKSLFNTKVCKILGIKYPVMQAGMGYLARGRLAAAVSNVGGLGVIGTGHLTLDELREEIRLAKSLTDKPFGVDILFGKIIADHSSQQVARYSHEVEKQIEITLEERVPVLISGLGNPLGVIKEAHQLGMVVMSVVGNVKQAVQLEKDGVDIIIAQGHEAGGHTGSVGTMVLVPQVVDAVKIPVVAAGGIADGRGLIASLSLGAGCVWMGTRFIASHEAHAHDNYKQKIVSINEEGTVISRGHSGKPVRMIKNNFTDYWKKRENEIHPYPLQLIEVGKEASKRARIDGDVENGVAPAGQISGMIKGVKSAGQIVEDIIQEAEEVLSRFQA